MKHAALACAFLALTAAHATDTEMGTEVVLICQQFAAKELKAPATARFESPATAAALPAPAGEYPGKVGVWNSVSYVDAQNEFGAMIRSRVMCTVEPRPGGKWRLVKKLHWFK